MKKTTPRAAVLTATLSILCLAEPADAKSHTNEEVGYRFSVPKDFIPKDANEFTFNGVSLGGSVYLADRFRCTKEIFPKEYSWGWSREMSTYFFPARTAAEIATAREKAKEASQADGGSTVSVQSTSEIYLSFEEYAKANIRGFFFEEEKKTKVAGFPARLYEMKFEKLTNVPQRWYACSYEVPGGEFAMMFTCTEQHFKQYKNEAKKAFSSFKILDGGLKGRDLITTQKTQSDGVDEDELTAEELLARRETQKRAAYDKCIADLEPGWRNFETDNFLVVYACKPTYAKLVSKHCEAVIRYLEETFGEIGTGFVQGSIIRVFADEKDIPGGWNISFRTGTVPEYKFARPSSRGYRAEFDSLSTNVMGHWFSEKNDLLWRRMPRWLSTGLREYIEDAEMKGSKLTFGKDEWEHDSMIEARNAQAKHEGPDANAPLKPIKLVMSMPSDQLFAGRYGFASSQCSSLVRYLLEGPGKKKKKTKVILSHYLGHIYDKVEAVEKEIKARKKEDAAREKSMEGMSDEEKLAAEDEAYLKKRDQAFDKVERQLLDDAFALTFKNWDESDWKSLDASWMKYAEGRTK